MATKAPALRAGPVRRSAAGSGQSSAAPNGFAGSVAASATRLAGWRSRSRSTAALGGELRAALAVDEVAASHPSGLLEPRERAIGEREAAEHALGDDRAARDDAVALEQRLAERVRPRGSPRARERQHRPAARPPAAGWPAPAAPAARSRRARAARATRRAAARAAWAPRSCAPAAGEQPAHRREGVVGHEPGPGESPERVDDRAARRSAPTASTSCRKK